MRVICLSALLLPFSLAFVPASLKKQSAANLSTKTSSTFGIASGSPSNKFSVTERSFITTALNAEGEGAVGEVNGTEKKKIIVLGGDGFCGWPTTLYLSDRGHDVVCVDNLSRRNIDTELGCDSLTPIQSPEVRFCRLFSICMKCPSMEFTRHHVILFSMLSCFFLSFFT